MAEPIRDEFPFIESLITLTKAKACVEIGVAYGDSTVILCKAAKQVGGFVYGFDVWEKWGLNKQAKVYGSMEIAIKKLRAAKLNNFHLTKIDTYGEREFFISELKRLCSNGIDFAFIDACHSYRGIKNDFSAVYPMLTKTGIIVFHDTLMIDGCREFILDLRTKFNDGSFDIIDFPFGKNEMRCGISVLVKRSYSIIDNPIKQIAGSISTPKEIEEREVEWLNDELKDRSGAMANLDKENNISLENLGFPIRRKFQ